jgi:hypothetical protein
LLTKDQIRKNLQADPQWEPDENASMAEWDLYDEVCDELFGEVDVEDTKSDTDNSTTGSAPKMVNAEDSAKKDESSESEEDENDEEETEDGDEDFSDDDDDWDSDEF